MLPKYIRKQLKSIGITHVFGVKIENWAEGERYKAGNDIIYCKQGKVVFIRRGLNWVWRKETVDDVDCAGDRHS